MCTVTWWYDHESYEVFFNRDELKTRLPELCPAVCVREGVKYIAPQDTDSGGTWILVNENGLTVGLLNQYPANAKSPLTPRVSRGVLMKSLADCQTVQEVGERLAVADLAHSMPFMIFAISVEAGAMVWTWDTHVLHRMEDAESQLPHTSSSFRTEEVVRARRHLFLNSLMEREDSLSPSFFQDYHRIAFKDEGAYAVCMEREDARTVSYCHIQVGLEKPIAFHYAPRSKVKNGFEPVTSVELQSHSLVQLNG